MKLLKTDDYFLLSRKESRGIAVVVAFILIFFTLPYLWQLRSKPNIAKADVHTLAAMAKLVAFKDSNNIAANNTGNYNSFEKGSFRDRDLSEWAYDKKQKGELFIFDPNKLDAAGWQRLGLAAKTAQTIVNYQSKGGRFYEPDDISKIYGLSDADIERLLPFVRIDKLALTSAKKEYVKFDIDTTQKNFGVKTNQNAKPAAGNNVFLVDVNTADTTSFKAFAGIGSKLSARIVNYRNKLGGFYSIAQVGETFGLPDSTFQKIKNQLQINADNITKININTASFEQLNAHPYINKSIANNIVQYRTQHGSYANENDIMKLALFKEEWWNKLKPYIVYE